MCRSLAYTNSEISDLICEHIHSKRDRMILFCRFIDGMTYESIAEEFDLSTVQTKRIVYRAEKILFQANVQN